MTLRMNNLKDGHYNQVFLLNTSSNAYEEVRDLINAAGGGAVSSATGPLAIDANGVISVDLSAYSLSSALAQALLLGTGNVIHTHDFQSPTITINDGVNSQALSLNTGGKIQINTDQIVTTSDLIGMNFINSLLVLDPLGIQTTANQNEYELSCAFKPTSVSAGTGITLSNQNDATGGLSIGADMTALQSKLTTLTELQQNPTMALDSDEPAGSWVTWTVGGSGAATNLTGSHQQIAVPSLSVSLTGLTTSGVTHWEMEVAKTHSLTQLVVAANDTNWATLKEWQFTNITATWMKISGQFASHSNGNVDLHIGYSTSTQGGSYTQTAGDIGIRFVRLWVGPFSKTVIGNDLKIAGPLALIDSSGIYRELEATPAGQLNWNGSALGGGSGVASIIGGGGISAALNTSTNAVTLNCDSTITSWSVLNPIITQINADIATKQDIITTLQSGTTVLLNTTHNPPRSGSGTWVLQGSPATHALVQCGSGWYHYMSISSSISGQIDWEFEVRLPSTNAVDLNAFFYLASGAHVSETLYSTSTFSTSNWTHVSLTCNLATATGIYWMLGSTGATNTQAAGYVEIRNMKVTHISPTLSCTSNYHVQGNITGSADLTITGHGYAVSFTNTSDARLKDNVEPINEADCVQMLRSLEPKTYTRNDLPAELCNDGVSRPPSRAGFIAQDVLSTSAPEWSNLTRYAGPDSLLHLDYGRLVVPLWGVCRNLISRIEALEADRDQQ